MEWRERPESVFFSTGELSVIYTCSLVRELRKQDRRRKLPDAGSLMAAAGTEILFDPAESTFGFWEAAEGLNV